MAIHLGLDGKRWKRAFRTGIVALGVAFAAAPLAASAHGNIWMDESVPQAERATAYQHIVVYPFRDMSADELLPGAYPDWDDELAQRLGKRIKHTEFVRATAPYDAAAVSDAIQMWMAISCRACASSASAWMSRPRRGRT